MGVRHDGVLGSTLRGSRPDDDPTNLADDHDRFTTHERVTPDHIV
jgi:hypothetical protein